MYYIYSIIQDSSVSIVTRLRAERPGLDSQQRQGSFISQTRPHRLWDPPASYPLGAGVSFPGDKAVAA
jgi:hypothetical protein